MANAKPKMYIRLRKDRLDLLKAMYKEVNIRRESTGGKPISFNAFMEDIIERFVYTDYGQVLCGMVDGRRKIESDGWKERKRRAAMSMDEEGA